MRIRIAGKKDAQGIAFVKVKTWQTTYKNIFPKEVLENLSIKKNTEHWREIISEGKKDKNTEIYVAETKEGKVVGFSAGGKNEQTFPYDCQIMAIYVLREHQRKGLGSKLVNIAVRKFLDLGFITMKIEVLDENPACFFYKKLGGVKDKVISWERWGKSFPLAIFVWEDINKIIQYLEKNKD